MFVIGSNRLAYSSVICNNTWCGVKVHSHYAVFWVFFAFLFVICVKRKEWVLYPFFAFDATSHRRNVAI